LFGLEARPVEIVGAARQKGVKGLAEVMAVERGKMKGLIFRKDLMVGKTLTVDVALADTGGGERLVIRAFD